MYEDLIKQLREKHQAYVATYNAKSGQIFKDSADAIERLLAEMAEVVRCKDCAMANVDSDERYIYCTIYHEYKPIDYYCAEGRREND